MKFGFLIYDSRSGSTLLASFLNAHPEIFVSLEALFILEAMKFRRETHRFPENEELLNLLREDKRLSEWSLGFLGLFEQIREREERVSLKRFTESLLEAAAKAEPFPERASPGSEKIAFLKQGLLSGYLPELREIWPEAFLLHIFRDGRAVFASKKRSVNVDTRKPMAMDPVHSARRWCGVQENVERVVGKGPVLEVRYEDLVLDQHLVLTAIWRFLHVENLTAEELSVEDYAARIPESQKQIHRLVGKKTDPSRLGAWKKNLTLREIWKYEKSAHGWLEKRGYSLATRRLPEIIRLALHKLKNRFSL